MMKATIFFPDIPDRGRHGTCGLTMHEAGEIVRRVGISRGYIPVSEYPVSIAGEKSRRRRVDWVWISKTSKLIAAFEIEGRDVPNSSIDFDIQKLNALDVEHRLILTYGVRFDPVHSKWRNLSGLGETRIKKRLGDIKTVVFIPEAELNNLWVRDFDTFIEKKYAPHSLL